MTPQQDGKPTGLLNEDGTMMQVHCLMNGEDGSQYYGTRWISITKDMKVKIMSGNNAVVSLGAQVTPEMAERIHSDELSAPTVAVSLDAQAVKPGTPLPEGVTLAAPVMNGEMTKDGMVYTSVPQSFKSSPATLAAAAGEHIDLTTGSLAPEFLGITGNSSLEFKGSTPLLDAPNLDRAASVGTQDVTVEEDEEWSRRDDLNGSEVLVAPPEHNRRASDVPEHSGFNVNYYSVPINHPKRPERKPYVFEVEDLIQALNMTFHEGTILKSLIRSCTERELGLVKQGGDAVRDAEKMVHSSQEHLRALKLGMAR